MKETNIKQIKQINNGSYKLPQYQFGTPDYVNNQTTNLGTITKLANQNPEQQDQQSVNLTNPINTSVLPQLQATDYFKTLGASKAQPTYAPNTYNAYAQHLINANPSFVPTPFSSTGSHVGVTWAGMKPASEWAAEESARLTEESLAHSAATNAGKAGINGLGVVTGGIGAIMGGLQMGQGINQMNNAVQSGDADMFTTTKQNVSPYGHYYDTMHLNTKQFGDLAKARANSGFLNTEMGAIGTGAGIGGVVGSIVPGIGNLVGTGVGAVVGGLAGLFGLTGRNSVINRAKQYAQDVLRQQSGYNKQNKSVATSMGMRDEYNAEHPNNISYAAEGKQAFDPKWNYQNGWAHNGEFQYRPSTDEGMTITNGTGSQENAPVYTEPEDVIYTDKFISRITGKNLAKSAEAAQSNLKNGFMPQQQKQLLAALAQEQGMYQKENIHKKYMNQYKCGKMPKYWGGKFGDDMKKILPYALPALGNYATNMLQLTNQRNLDSKMSTTQRSSYVPSPSATTYANIARPIKDNSFINALRNEAAMQHYANDKSGYGQGLHAAVGNQININKMNALVNGYRNMDLNFFNQRNDYAKNLASLLNVNPRQQQQALISQYQMENAKTSRKNDYLRDDLASMMATNNDFTQNLIDIPTYLRTLGRYDSDYGLV